MSEQCVERFWPSGSFTSVRCAKPAKLDEDGKMRCGTHSLAAKRKRDEKRSARWAKNDAARERAADIHRLERAVLAACVEEDKALSVDTSYTPTPELDAAYARMADASRARFAAVRRYRALLDGKAKGKEA